MTFTRRSLAPVLCVAVAALALSAVGCGGDGVEKYTVPRTTEPTVAKRDPHAGMNDKDDPHAGIPGAPQLGAGGPVTGGGNYRILGAMYPTGQPGWFWFFKFAGPADAITAAEADFDKLTQSVKLGAPGSVPTFDLPAGWERTGPRVLGAGGPVQVRFDEVLKVGSVECTISSAGGGVDGNLTRWAGQVGATPGRAPTEFTANGVTALRVDLRGSKNPVGGMGGGPFAGKRP